MIGIIGIVVVLVMVFGGYLAAGGTMEIILKALPYEMIMIGGAAIGGFLLGNDLATIKRTGRDMVSVFKGPRWKASDYHDLLCLLFELIWIARQNPVAIEEHIEDPENSSVFAKFPRIRADQEAVELISDTMRSASMNYDDPMQVEEVLDKRLDANLQHALHTSHAVRIVADALPAIGIVAAVLGIIKTMGSIDQPPAVLGVYIGGALTGTFLGVFLSYCFVGPIAERMRTIVEEDAHFLTLIREVLVANLHAHPANICIEVGRQNAPHHFRPSFAELEESMREVKKTAA
ncbi:flagellar motor stator protein MotA [Rhodobacteraceae bacterium 2376]|uniref:Flagellar motor stator protein MotA n=1 Tax=Rhabdonatronobacter sediminivivens TaxID=2743469 RepID=A0A7Z0HXM1_9RHOB|nr:flagellar motor stator protein MotA [Rhabdonatronobacter sediminivivens]NYS24117.1 flagellar motor stator protein MotA [Rhabdonatronobacter sediminivivens]